MRIRFLFITFVVSAGSRLLSQSSGITTYCNPIDINYQYNFEQMNEGISYRSGADPVIVNHRNEYYLFVTISGGWWHSSDLLHWDYVTPDKWPVEDICAPAALSVRDTLYLLQSTFERRPIFFTTDPSSGHLEYFNRLLPQLPDSVKGPWDPDIFYDDDTDRWYMFWGSSNVYPIWGSELDKARHLVCKGSPVALLSLHSDLHGWERFGRDHRDTTRPYIEGAWMTKHNGTYYLQYAAPGTEYNVYANGTYIGKHPLGPFTYAPYNPVSYKPGGFMAGAGHGNTFQDKYGNWWNTGTPWVAVNWNFERRIAMFPAGFDGDGVMFSNTRFGDFPHRIPRERWTNPDELFTGWMLLSYRKPAVASSANDSFPASNVTDENVRSFWVAAHNGPGEWLTIDLKGPRNVRAIQVNFADFRSGIYRSDSTVYTQFRILSSLDGRTWKLIADLTGEKRDRPNAYIELQRATKARYIKYEHVFVASANLAISDVRVFGNADGPLPDTPRMLRIRRETDRRNALISWKPVPGVVGYNIRWGIRPDKLYQSYQRFADEENPFELRALNIDQEYYVAIESFDEVGVSHLSEVVHCR
ncbi:MAG TPA: family 43 glycosylhydrolase [Bacteroidota bacterium]